MESSSTDKAPLPGAGQIESKKKSTAAVKSRNIPYDSLFYSCKACGWSATVLQRIKDHIRKKHPTLDSSIKNYAPSFKKVKSNDGNKTEHGNGPADMYKCIYCVSMLRTKHEMVDHVKVVHKFNTQEYSLATNISVLSSGVQVENQSSSSLNNVLKKATFKPPLLSTVPKKTHPVVGPSGDSASMIYTPQRLCDTDSNLNNRMGKVGGSSKSRKVNYFKELRNFVTNSSSSMNVERSCSENINLNNNAAESISTDAD